MNDNHGNDCVMIMMLSVTNFNNILVIYKRLVLLVKEIVVLAENQRPVARHWQTVSYNGVSRAPRYERDSNSQP